MYRLLPEDGAPGPGRRVPLGLVALNADILPPAPFSFPPPFLGSAVTRSRAASASSPAWTCPPDGGATWAPAELLKDLGPWAWRHWHAPPWTLPPGEHELLVRAWDSSAATQPEDEASLWNPKGYVNNARPRKDKGARHL